MPVAFDAATATALREGWDFLKKAQHAKLNALERHSLGISADVLKWIADEMDDMQLQATTCRMQPEL